MFGALRSILYHHFYTCGENFSPEINRNFDSICGYDRLICMAWLNSLYRSIFAGAIVDVGRL